MSVVYGAGYGGKTMRWRGGKRETSSYYHFFFFFVKPDVRYIDIIIYKYSGVIMSL